MGKSAVRGQACLLIRATRMLLFHGMLVPVPIATCRPMGTLQWRGGPGGVNFVPSLGGPVCDSKELDLSLLY